MTPLRFRNDGTFTIVQLTDLHWKNGEPEDLRTDALMRSILESENPDLIVFTGDVIHSEECNDPVASYRQAVQAAEEQKIPWAAVFGNHDAERCSKEELAAVRVGSAFGLDQRGPGIDGRLGDGVLEVASRDGSRTAAALYLLDSGSNLHTPPGGYEWITHGQIGWYKEQSARLAAGKGGVPLPSLAFFHIPLPEFNELWNYHTCYGHNHEGMGCPKVNSGLFTALLEQGDVSGVFVGHDHINDFWGELHGISLCYGRATGYNSYGLEGYPRGARVIRLTEGERGFASWLRLDDGSVVTEQPEHPPEQVWKRI